MTTTIKPEHRVSQQEWSRNNVTSAIDAQVQNHSDISIGLSMNMTKINGNNEELKRAIKPTNKRFFILLMFVMLQLIKSFQWICLGSITNVVANFYQVDNLAINWTTILFMITFLMFAIPVSWLIEFVGLRRSVLIGSLGVTAGLIIKVFSCTRDGFWLGMLGHLIVGLSEPFFFSSYSQVASLWFPDNQVASATSLAINGEQMGIALGFIVPPLLVGSDPDNIEAVQRGLFYMFLGNAVISTANTICVYLFFDNEPKFAPGVARFNQMIERRASQNDQLNLLGHVKQQLQQLKSMLTDKNFNLLLVGFGINVGSAYSIHTLLNQMIVGPPLNDETGGSTLQVGWSSNATSFEHSMVSNANNWDAEDPSLIVGNTGFILIIAGLFGSTTCGSLLDRYHRYKLTSAFIYLLALVSMLAVTYCITLEKALLMYLLAVPLGFALTGYEGCGFDYGVEITYPTTELLSATVLNVSAQLFGIPISLVGSCIVDLYGSRAMGLFFCLVMLCGFVISCVQGGTLKRQTVVNQNNPSLSFQCSDLATRNKVDN